MDSTSPYQNEIQQLTSLVIMLMLENALKMHESAMNYHFWIIYSTIKREKKLKQLVGFNKGNNKVICPGSWISFTFFLQTSLFQTYFHHLAEPSTGIWLCKLRSLDLCRHRTLASRAGRPFINVTFSELTVARRVHLWPRLQRLLFIIVDQARAIFTHPGAAMRCGPLHVLFSGNWILASHFIYGLSCSRSSPPMTKIKCWIQVYVCMFMWNSEWFSFADCVICAYLMHTWCNFHFVWVICWYLFSY